VDYLKPEDLSATNNSIPIRKIDPFLSALDILRSLVIS
jgi:hypothetical protein